MQREALEFRPYREAFICNAALAVKCDPSWSCMLDGSSGTAAGHAGLLRLCEGKTSKSERCVQLICMHTFRRACI